MGFACQLPGTRVKNIFRSSEDILILVTIKWGFNDASDCGVEEVARL